MEEGHVGLHRVNKSADAALQIQHELRLNETMRRQLKQNASNGMGCKCRMAASKTKMGHVENVSDEIVLSRITNIESCREKK